MKKIVYILCILNFVQTAFAQDKLKRADTYFERAFYSDAIPLYEQLLPANKSSKLIKNLADSHYNTFNLKSAARWYGYLADNYGDTLDESYFFKLNQSLKALGQNEKAHQVLLNFYAAQNDTAKSDQLKKDIIYLDNVSAIGERFAIENLALNTPNSEFGAAEVDSNLVYSASRKKAKTLPKLYRWNNQNYLDIYTHPVDKINVDNSLSVALPGAVNSKLHEGTFAITKDRKTLYFTRNSKQRTDTKISNLKIYKAEWMNGNWQNITPLPFNSDDFSTEHPALNADETKLYFASDREGGFGGFDLYSVTLKADGFYGNPINLGQHINTDKKEQFPFLDAQDNLYFASNGHPGFGLLDVFIAKKNGSDFESPNNLGLPVNSGYDDFSLWMDFDGKTGYFSSNRPTGKGSDDIYAFSETKPLLIENCKQYITGTLIDLTTGMPLANGQIKLVGTDGKIVETLITKKDASFKFLVECSNSYRIEGKKDGYEANFKSLRTDDARNSIKDGSLTLYSVTEREKQKTFALEREKEEAEKLVSLQVERKLATEKAAEEKRIQREKENKEQEKEAQQIAEKKRLQNIEEIIKKEKTIVKKDEKIIIQTEEIHFDYSLWYLRRESRDRLAKVIEIMKANPGMVLEIGTHTDIRGNAEYNRDLSQKRADAAKAFMVENGIANHRVIAKGYGESKPLVKCATEESCTEEDHEWNRRCELVVVKWD